MRSLVLFAAALPLYSQITIDTFAGGAVRSGVPAQSVFLENINGLAWGPAGNVVFCDQQNNVIRRVRTDGILETIAGTGGMGYAGDGGPATAALLSNPTAPRFDGAGNLYFADVGNRRIRRVDPKGTITTVAGDGIPFASGMDTNGPATQRSIDIVWDLAVDAAGNIYLNESNLFRLRKVTPDGLIHDLLTVSAAAGTDLAALGIDGAGNLYVLERQGFQHQLILRITPDGTSSTFREWTATGASSVPFISTMTADAAGNVWVVTGSGAIGNNIERLGADGSTTLVAGGGGFGYVSSPDGPALNTVIYPFALAVDARGNIGFADTFTPVNHYLTLNEVRVVTSDGQLKTLAGANPQIAPDGTPLKSAWFLSPTSVAFSRSGDLYIAENRSCKIRKIGADGVLTTFAGTGNCAYPTPAGPNAKTSDIPQPGSIALDSQGRVWMADAMLNLYSIAQDGTVGIIIKTPVEGGTGKIAIDSKDRVYVLGLDSLYRVMADGTYQALIPPPSNGGSGKIGDLTGIGSDPSGQVYFTAAGTTYAVNADGTFTAAYPNSGYANSLAFDASHRVWQGTGSGEIDVTSPAGTARLGALLPGITGDGGPVNAARMWTPGAVAFSPSGDLYFLDATRVRRLTGIGNAVTAPTITPGGVVNAASYTGAGIAPGELVAVFGSNFGATGIQTAPLENNAYPPGLGRTHVFFNGFPGAVTAVAPGQINAIVPTSGVDTSGTVSVVVQVDAVISLPLTVQAAPAAPGISAANQSGSGQGAIVNQDGTPNSAGNPAARGSVVSIYGTGLGPMTPRLFNGQLAISTPYPQPVGMVTAAIGGQPAEVVYAGDAPFEADGVFQVNARIPAGAAVGNDVVTVAVGGVSSAQNVTVAVR
jgi:uncharacterized protein (TIGR03437 family)